HAGRLTASSKSTTAFGSQASWIMISDISTTRLAGSNPLQIPSDQKCYLCRRYKPLPMCPERTRKKLERAKGFEPSIPTLARSCSTTELHPHPSDWRRWAAGNGQSYAKCGSRMQQPAHGPKSARSPFIGNNAQRFIQNDARTVANIAL